MLKLILVVGGIALFTWAVITPWQAQHNGGTGSMAEDLARQIKADRERFISRPLAARARAQVRAEATKNCELPTWNHLPSRTDLGVSDAERDLIMNLQEESGVPGWVLYGIWRNESNCLSSGWYEGGSWRRARDMAAAGSKCRNERGNLCLEAWDALRSICAQRRSDGSVVCDPDEVWTSYTLAMGALQQMPKPFLIDSRDRWQEHVTDYNGDGVYDPHDLQDAMATTAVFLRNQTIRLGSLQAAVQAYAGNTPHGHYVKLVRVYRPQWCAVDGYCD